jgi:hypothetical protein
MHVDVTSLVFDEPDAFREHVSAWGDAEIVPLSRGGLSLVWNQVAYDDMVIAHHGVTGSFADLCTINPRWRFFAICLAPTGTIWCGLDIEPGHLLIMAPGREYRSRMEQWESLEIVLSDRLVEQAGLFDQAALRVDLAPEQCVLPLDHAQVTTFRALAQSLDAALTLEVELAIASPTPSGNAPWSCWRAPCAEARRAARWSSPCTGSRVTTWPSAPSRSWTRATRSHRP